MTDDAKAREVGEMIGRMKRMSAILTQLAMRGELAIGASLDRPGEFTLIANVGELPETGQTSEFSVLGKLNPFHGKEEFDSPTKNLILVVTDAFGKITVAGGGDATAEEDKALADLLTAAFPYSKATPDGQAAPAQPPTPKPDPAPQAGRKHRAACGACKGQVGAAELVLFRRMIAAAKADRLALVAMSDREDGTDTFFACEYGIDGSPTLLAAMAHDPKKLMRLLAPPVEGGIRAHTPPGFSPAVYDRIVQRAHKMAEAIGLPYLDSMAIVGLEEAVKASEKEYRDALAALVGWDGIGG